MHKKVTGVILLVLGIALDLYSKSYVFQHYMFAQKTPVIFFLSWAPVYNTGIAWSIASNHGVLITIISFSLSLMCITEFIRNPGFFWGFICAGGVANTFDRVVYGAVRDFIALSYGAHHFPIFNIADCYLSLGILMLFMQHYFGSSRHFTLLGDR